MSTETYFATLLLAAACVVGVFFIMGRQRVRTAQAEAIPGEAYRALAERLEVQQRDQQATLVALRQELAQMNTRVGEIERLLKQVG